jgi:hypothetical protein
MALRRGSLRWLVAEDHTLVFEREASDSSERIVVQVSRAPHRAVTLPGWWFAEATTLFGTQQPTRDAEGSWQLPGDGPAAHVWRVR